jgi:hypothetical protein
MKTKVFISSLLVLSFLCFTVFAQTGQGPSKKISLTKKTEQPQQQQPTMRGSGDPTKGLGINEDIPDQLTFGDYYAFIIGIDKYTGKWAELSNGVRDAKTVEQTLKNSYQFDHFKTLYDGQATKANIVTELEWLMNNIKPEDNLLIYYSGHGEYNQMMDKGFWVPVDAKGSSTIDLLSNNDLLAYLNGIKSKHTLLISDACFSGDIFRGSAISKEFEDSPKYYREVNSQASRKAITSGGIEPVMDGGSDGHSIFAYWLLKTLNDNQKRFLDATELFQAITIPVINNSEQKPEFHPIKNTGDAGGQFIFRRK